MADVQAARSMEDFFVNATVLRSSLATPRSMADDISLYHASAPNKNDIPLNHKAMPQRGSHIHHDSISNRYNSDEEPASPIDNEDDMDDDDDDLSLLSDESFEIHEAVLFTPVAAVRECRCAQAVTIQAAGKARMIELSSRNRNSMPSSPVSWGKRPSLPRLDSKAAIESTRSSEDSQSTGNDSVGSASVYSPASTAPSSVDEALTPRPPFPHQRSMSRHVDLMEAAKAITPTSPSVSANAPIWQASPALSMRSRTVSNAPSHSSTSNKLVRRKAKFTSNFSLNKINKSLAGSDLESVKEPEPKYVAPAVPQLRNAPRPSSFRTRLVARGANERAPMIELPPFPDEHNRQSRREGTNSDYWAHATRRKSLSGKTISVA